MDFVLLGRVEHFEVVADDFERLWRLSQFFVFEIIVDFDESGRHIIYGFIEFDEFQLFLFAVLYLFGQFVEFFSVASVTLGQQLISSL